MYSLLLPRAAYLRQCFDYDPQTGELRWRERPREHFANARGHWVHGGRYAGQPAGHFRPKGVVVFLDGRAVRAARIIWKMMTGRDPREAVDHIDRDPSNNRWSNLRQATHGQNRANSGANRGRTLPKGVYDDRGRFRAIIRINSKNASLGHYDTPAEAHAAYVGAARRQYG